MIKERNPIMVIILMMCTFGIYGIYWIFVTSKELQELGAELPSIILVFIPIANIYYLYVYLKEWHRVVNYEQDFMMVLLIYFVFSPLAIYWVQTELNKKATA